MSESVSARINEAVGNGRSISSLSGSLIIGRVLPVYSEVGLNIRRQISLRDVVIQVRNDVRRST